MTGIAFRGAGCGLCPLLLALACGGIGVKALRVHVERGQEPRPPAVYEADLQQRKAAETFESQAELDQRKAEETSESAESLEFVKNASLRMVSIQKTGTTSFGDFVIPYFCRVGEVCGRSIAHHDWDQATANGAYTGPVVTLLRNPVERAMSEFFYLRDTDGLADGRSAHWDFNNDTWLEAIQDENISKALDVYIHGYPKNPSRNRQTLYVLGFRGRRPHGMDDRGHEEPGAAYDWDTNPAVIVRKAVEHLDNMTAFGFTDCWHTSMKAISRAMNWDSAKMNRVSFSRHEKDWRSLLVERKKPDYWRLKRWLGKDVDIDTETKWSKLLPKRYTYAIEMWSRVDMQFWREARHRFTQRFGERCRDW